MTATEELSVNMAAFDSHLFQKHELWLVTVEPLLWKSDGKLARCEKRASGTNAASFGNNDRRGMTVVTNTT